MVTPLTSYSGVTSLADGLTSGLNVMVASARRTREHMGKIAMLCERHMLRRGTGLAWIEPQVGQVQAQNITQNQELENPQQIRIVRTLSIVPKAVAVQIMMTDDIQGHIDPRVWAQMGYQAQAAITRKQDQDGLLAFNAAGKLYGADGASFDVHKIRSAASIMRGNTEEPAMGPINCVAHRFQIKDIEDLFSSNIGGSDYGQTTQGLSQAVFQNGWRGRVADVMVYEDNLIPITNNTARAVVFPREGMVLINDSIMSREVERKPRYGEGADLVILREKYGYGPRNSHIWAAQIRSDATEPT